MPVMNNSGMNTAMSETLKEMMVKPICLAPLSAACMGASPFSMYRTMFSIITMASSTTNPVAMVRAMRERLSRLKPTSFMMPKVPISVSGRATLGITVAQNLRRKTKITITTSATASTSVICTSRTDARIVSVRSVRMAILTEVGEIERSRGSNALTRLAVSMMLAPGWRWMSTMTAGRPSTQPPRRTFSTLSITSPTSRMRMGTPFRLVRMTSRNSVTVKIWSLALMA